MSQSLPRLINENFLSWFEDSQGKDGNNQPQVFYHKSRTKEKFNIFYHHLGDKNVYNDCYGFYFVADYHKHCIDYIGDGIDYYVYLKMKKPFRIYDDGRGFIKDMNDKNYKHLDINRGFCLDLESQGYDSIIINCPMYYSQYIVFNNHQIKSVFNNGEYSKENIDIFL